MKTRKATSWAPFGVIQKRDRVMYTDQRDVDTSWADFDTLKEQGTFSPTKYMPPPSAHAYASSRLPPADVTDKVVTDYCEKVLHAWMKTREQIYGLRKVDNAHICTFNSCIETDNIQMIDRSQNLYGCIVSGIYHRCKGCTDTCRNTTLDPEGCISCTFSGIGLGVKIEGRLYGKPKTGMGRFDESAEPSTEELEIQNGLERALASHYPGFVDGSPCNVRRKHAASLGPRGNTDVFMEENFASITINESTSEKRKNKRRRCFLDNKSASARQDIHAVIHDLLFNQSERKRIDQARVSEMELYASNAVRKFYKRHKRAKTRPNRHETEKMYCHCMNKKLRLRPLEHDPQRREKYIHIIHTIWKIIVNTPYCKEHHSKFHIKQHSIGILYTMQMPFTAVETEGTQSIKLLSEDPFLYTNLPHQNDLKGWRSCHVKGWTYSKQDITIGRNNFKKSLNSIKDVQQRKQAFDRIRKVAGLE